VELIKGHIYRDSDGDVFQATKPENAPFALALFRINIYKGTLLYPIIAGSIAGYVQNDQGLWNVLRVGDPKYTKERMVLRPYPYFESDILPNLQHVAGNLNDYLKGL
jgi:hypothetical protein